MLLIPTYTEETNSPDVVISTVTGYTSYPIGGMSISLGVDDNGVIQGFDASFVSTGYSLSKNSLVIGGVPLSLYENSKGRRAIAVVIDDSGTDDESLLKTNFVGHLWAVKHISYQYMLGVKIGSSPSSNSTFVWQGQPLGISSTNQVEMVEVTLNSVDEESTYMLNGTPMLTRRSGQNWYMVMREVS